MQNADGGDARASLCVEFAGGSDDTFAAKERGMEDVADYMDVVMPRTFHGLPMTELTTCSTEEAKGRANAADVALARGKADAVTREGRMDNL